MNIEEGLTGLRQLTPGAVLSIGNFDGMHRGHQRLLSYAQDLKRQSRANAVGVVTFEPHPLTVLRPEAVPPRLTPPPIKRQLLAAAGVDVLVVLPPSHEVLDLTAEQFWQLLRDQTRPSHLVEGTSFNFGKGRGGTIDTLRHWTASSDIRLHVIDAVRVPLVDMQVAPVSSSLIRFLLGNGRVRDAAICLGRGYELEGTVEQGARRGRELGVPTANLKCAEQLIPADGVYAGRCRVGGKPWPAAISVGTNPTFGTNPRTVEAHLIDFSGDLYGHTLRLEFIDWIREQQTFTTLESLKEWIARDLAQTLERQNQDPAQAIAAA